MSNQKDNIHAEHRKRVRERFRNEGLDHFSEVHALELLLFYAIGRKDTNPLAHELLNRFGSLTQVLDAPVEELEKVEGIGEKTSTLLMLAREISRYYMVNQARACNIMEDTAACGRYLLPHFVGRRDETVFLLCLDAKSKVICCKELGSGSVNATAISIRKVVEAALAVNATAVVLAHNHPSGFAVPSDDDILTTRRIGCALDAVGVTLLDHVVVADGDYVSMLESGFYRPEDCRMLL